MEKDKKSQGQAEEQALLLKSYETFTRVYEKTGKVSALLALHKFNKFVKDGVLGSSEAHRILNSKKEVKNILDAAEAVFLESQQGILFKIGNNTTFTSHMKSGIASGVAVGMVFLVLSSFANALLQPIADELLKRPPEADGVVPVVVWPGASELTVNNNQFFFFSPQAKERTKAPIVPKKKTVKTKHHHRYH